MKILAMKWRQLGDSVLWTSALEALLQHYPNAAIDLAVDSANRELFENDDRWRRVYALTSGQEREHLSSWRGEKYDLVLNFHASSRTAVLAKMIGAEKTFVHHHSRKPRRAFSSESIVDLGKPAAAQERDLNVVRTLGWSSKSPKTHIVVDQKMKEAAKERLLHFGWDGRSPLLMVGPTATRPAKRWDWTRYEKVMQESKGFSLVLAPSKEAFSPYWQRRWKDRIFLTPSLKELAATLSFADCFLSSDSGAKHLAIAVGTSTVTLFGPESIAEWHGYDKEKFPVISRPVDCRSENRESPEFAWCGVTVCPYGSHACMNLIQADEVLREVDRFL